jgi:uncharacterized protein (DUF2062 family)
MPYSFAHSFVECTDMLGAVANWLHRRVVLPIRMLLRMGATPERLAWSLAVGLVVGVNPLLGSTTLLALGVAAAFRLNLFASQLGNHAMYPVELAMFPVFVKLGAMAFRTSRLPWGHHELWIAARTQPWQTTRVLWVWEWHALVVWAAFAAVAVPAIALAMRPLLEHMARRMNRERLPLS